MKKSPNVVACSLILLGTPLLAQSSPTAVASVPLTSEHHHHLVFSNSRVRAFYVVLPVKDRTLIHRHDVDYVWVGLGEADVINATVNKPEVPLHSMDGALHFSVGPFAHAAINAGDQTYRNVTVELLQKQDNPRNLCEKVIESRPTDCVAANAESFQYQDGVKVEAEFATDEIEFDKVSIQPGAQMTLAPSPIPPLVIALEKTDAPAGKSSDDKGSHESRNLTSGDVVSAVAGTPLTLRNVGSDPARFMVFEFKGTK